MASSTTIPALEENTNAVVVSAGNAADNKEPRKSRRNRMRRIAERKRRSRLRNHFSELESLVPNVTENEKINDKGDLVEQTIAYIQSLERTKAMLEKRKQQLALARQVAASSSAPPQTARGKMAPAPVAPLLQPLAAAVPVSAAADDVPQPQPLVQQPLAVAAAVPPPQPLPVAAAGQGGFQTWSWPNLVLNVSNNNAYINVCVPRHLGMQNMVMVLSVLNNHGIDVVTTQVDADAARSVLNFYTRVTRMGGGNPSSEEVYKLATSEILLLLNTN